VTDEVRGARGAYLHVPYCAHRCTYCSFTAVTERESEGGYFQALLREVEARAAEVEGPLETLYLGGGTPSYVAPSLLRSVVERLAARHGFVPDPEITAEANPDDLDEARLVALRASGVNRLSIGVQSTSDGELALLERRHDSSSAIDALRRGARLFPRLSGDLMIGVPGQTRESLRRSTEELLGTGVGHVSVYLLEMEKAPRLVALAKERPELFPDDEETADRWLLVDSLCASAGLARYEVSNWARPGEESRHNLKYWRREPVPGYGVSAHSFDGAVRRASSGSIPEYVRRVGEEGTAFVSESSLSPDEAVREEAMLGLRLAEGIPAELLKRAAATLPASDRERLGDAAAAGLLERARERVRLTTKGVLLSNEVFALLL